MKKLLLTTMLLMVCTGAYAQSDYSVTWDLNGSAGLLGVTIDLDIGTTFISAHGGVDYDDGSTEPMTGTCFFTTGGGIFCTSSITEGLTGVLDIGASLDGTWEVIDIDGFIVESAIATFFDVE